MKKKLVPLLKRLHKLNIERKLAYKDGPLHSPDTREAARKRMTARREIQKELHAILGKNAWSLLEEIFTMDFKD
jgi:hypothetical protein